MSKSSIRHKGAVTFFSCPFEKKKERKKKTLSTAGFISFTHLLVRWGHRGATAGWGNLLKRSDNRPSAAWIDKIFFLCRYSLTCVCVGSLRLLPASAHSPTTCAWDKLETLNCPSVWLWLLVSVYIAVQIERNLHSMSWRWIHVNLHSPTEKLQDSKLQFLRVQHDHSVHFSQFQNMI